VTLAAWRTGSGDGSVTVGLQAGHRMRPLVLQVLWQRPTTVNTSTVLGTILLPPTHDLRRFDTPSDWYDGWSAFTLERLFLASRDRTFLWHVSSSPMLPTMGDGYLYLGSDSPIWLTHSTVLFTGAQLHFIPHRAGQHCSPYEALNTRLLETTNQRIFRANGEVTYSATVLTGPAQVRSSLQLALRVDFDSVQTRVPKLTAAALESGADFQLNLDKDITIASGWHMDRAILFTVQPDASQQTLVLGLRLLHELSTAWAVEATGQQTAVRLSSLAAASDSSVPDGVHWVVAVAGILLLGASAYWVSYLGHTLRAYYVPDREHLRHHAEVTVTLGHLIFGYIVLIMSTLVHVLMGVYGPQNIPVSTSLEESIDQLIVSQWIGTIVAGSLFFVLLVLESHHIASHRGPGVPVQLFGIMLGMLASRGVLAALLVSASEHLGILFVTYIAALAMGFFSGIYGGVVLLIHLVSGVELYRYGQQGIERDHRVCGTWWWLKLIGFFVTLGLGVAVGVTYTIWLWVPWLDLMNTAYSSTLVTATAIAGVALPLYLVAYSINEQVNLADVSRLARQKKSL